jgi:hypothetical protein
MIPKTLDDLLPDLPPGSFLLKNMTATPVHVGVVKWSYTDKTANLQQRSIYCDAYLASPVDPLVNPHDLALVSPGGCTRQEYFGGLKAGSFLGSPVGSAHNKTLLDVKERIAAVQISIDSVIFADGQIWGPDTLHYYSTIMHRRAASESVTQDLIAAKNAGEDLSSRLEKIRDETRTKKDQFSLLRADEAAMIQRSPNPEGTLRWLQQRTPLPEFRHIGGQH